MVVKCTVCGEEEDLFNVKIPKFEFVTVLGNGVEKICLECRDLAIKEFLGKERNSTTIAVLAEQVTFWEQKAEAVEARAESIFRSFNEYKRRYPLSKFKE